MLNSSSNQPNNSNNTTSRNRRNYATTNHASESSTSPTSSSSNGNNRPITRSYIKRQQQSYNRSINQQQQSNRNISISPALSRSSSSSSSTSSSLDSIDVNVNVSSSNPQHPFYLQTQIKTNNATQSSDEMMQTSSTTTSMFSFNNAATTSQTVTNPMSFGPIGNSFSVLPQRPTPNTAYQKIITNERPVNLINLLENSRITGRPIHNLSTLPDKTIEFVSERLKTHDYPILIKRLDQSSVTINLRNGSKEANDLVQILKEIENRLVNYNPNGNDENINDNENQTREEYDVEAIKLESAKAFKAYGGIKLFKRILLMNILLFDSPSSSNQQPQQTPMNVDETSNCRLINTSYSADMNKSIFDNYRLKPIEQIQQQLAAYTTTNTTATTNNYEKLFMLKIKCKCIQILNRLVAVPNFGKQLVYELIQYNRVDVVDSKPKNESFDGELLAYDTSFLQYLFSLFMFKESRMQACQLVESILLHIPMLNLKRVDNLRYILESIDDDGLASICKIFALTLSNVETNERKYFAPPAVVSNPVENTQQQQTTIDNNGNTKKSATTTTPPSIRDQNQEFLLNIPSLLFRLVNLVRRKDYTIRFTGANTEIENWMRYIDQALSDSEDEEMETDVSLNTSLNSSTMNEYSATTSQRRRSNDISTSSLIDGLTSHQPALQAAAKLNNFVYVLYTISLLLIGKEKRKVQKSLTKLRLAPALNSLFDYLIWNCRCEYPNSPSESSSSSSSQQQQRMAHICPEVAVKIQFLRLVHSFCDHSSFKRVLLSKEETAELMKYNQEADECLRVDESVFKVESRFRCTMEIPVGLLSKLVLVIKQEPFSASFRFWLIRAIESYLRGSTSYADQLFLINRGIVQDAVQNILAVNFARPKEVVQSCFDMLGELIKFNTKGFQIINDELLDNEKFNIMLTMINQSLIDSNMFLRSIFLSIDFFDANANTLEFKTSSNRLLNYFDTFDRRISILCKMINTINTHNLSQENVSCLNTALIVLMLANRRGLMPKFLNAISVKSREMETNLSPEAILLNSRAHHPHQQQPQHPINLICNFKDLLVFWQSHYLQKDKDFSGLEQNSKIKFAYWTSTVEMLLSPNSNNPCSLNYYLKNDSSICCNKQLRPD